MIAWPHRTVLPHPADEDPFWTGGASGELRIQRCAQCRWWLHPPGVVCPQCLSDQLSYEPVSGRGTVYSYTVNHHPWTPDLPVPYVLAVVELVEQPLLRLVSNVVGEERERADVGSAVVVDFEQAGDVWLPVFRLEGV
jgi:uncharacterized OB-fold protein